MKKTLFLSLGLVISMTGFAAATAGVTFAGNSDDSGITYTLPQVGALPNNEANAALFFGNGFDCSRRNGPGGFKTVNPRDAVVVRGPDASEVTQPAAPSWWYYTGTGQAQFGFVCQDLTPVPPAVHLEPYGQIVGPFRYTHYACEMNNSQSNRPNDFTCAYTTVKNGKDQEVRLRMTVPAHQIYRSPLTFVQQGTTMWMWSHTTDERIVRNRAVPDRLWRGPLPADWVVGFSYE